MKRFGQKTVCLLFSVLLIFMSLSFGAATVNAEQKKSAEEIVQSMTLDEKISQMIIPAIRSWNDKDITKLSDAKGLSEALQKHQYGGIILFGANVVGTEQTARLLYDLQVNNAKINASTNIPYLTPADVEGGIVNRLAMGTRMTGNMAIGATGDKAEENAQITGEILAEEMAALGFNADCAPVIDVNSDPNNPVIGTRSFSDDPKTVSLLGKAFQKGLSKSNIIATYKHFPGHGDTEVDSHIGTPSVNLTYEELKSCELIPFKDVIDAGADMIMTAHITYPKIDEEQTFADGSKGYYPATMSHKMITEILRKDMGYDGVVITDALEMDAIAKASLVKGDRYSAEYSANIAEKVINSGVDILLIPTDLNGTEVNIKIDDKNKITLNKIEWYDEYIDRLIKKVNDKQISEDRINESVLRILKMKEKYGILDKDYSSIDINAAVSNAQKVVGSDEHHKKEMDIANQAITIVRNEKNTLPLSAEKINVVLAGRTETDLKGLYNEIKFLQNSGILPKDAYVANLNDGTKTGDENSSVKITLDYYFDKYKDGCDLQKAILDADAAIAISNCWNNEDISKDAQQYTGIQAMIKDAHSKDAKLIVLSNNLPYDSARYQDADAIVLAYMGSAMGTDPTERTNNSTGAYNANVIAALAQIFGEKASPGKLPVNVPMLKESKDGKLSVTDQILYKRGFGLEV